MSAVKLKKPDVIESDFKVTTDQLRWIRMLIVRVKKAIDAGNFYPTPSVMNCGGCPFQETCVRHGLKGSSRILFERASH